MSFIAQEGVKHVFMLPGGGAMHLVDSLGRSDGLEYVVNLHEQACAIAADAYAQYTNNLGVAMVTTGPGGTNTLTGLAAAWLDSTPVLFISGQVKRSDMIGERGVRQMGFQEIDIVSIVRPITKYAVTILEPDTIRYHLEKAVYLARNGRPGPVWVDIPLDVQDADITPKALSGFDPYEIQPQYNNNLLSHQVKKTIQLFNEAERPVILAGNGIRLGKAVEEFNQLIEHIKVPVLTTWKAIDLLPEDHPLYAGRPGAVGQRGANFTQQASDWLLILGARLDLGQTAYNHTGFAPSAKKVMVDIDKAEIDKMMSPIDVPVHADIKDFLREFLRQIHKVSDKDRSAWLLQTKQWKEKYPVVLPEYWEQEGYVNDYVLIQVLSEEMSHDDLLIPGSSGACSERTMQAFAVKEGVRVFNSQGLGAMGFGLPASIGGCLASARKRTVSIEGDGGFVMNMQELETVRRLNLPIKFFVLNNQGYGSIRATQRNYFDGRYVGSTPSSGLTLPQWSLVAKAFGLPYLRIENHDQVREQVQRALDMEGPVLTEVMVHPDQPTAPRVTSRRLEDGTMVT
ncbi:MAG: thiamine pyrophosphate-binding protein, partial [Deltaproteobacteria bacterium]